MTATQKQETTVGKQYANIPEMLSGSKADRTLINEVDDEIRRREIVMAISALRARKGLTQSDIAKIVGCSQSRISKIEASCDEELKIGDLAAYLKAIEMDLAMLLHPPGKSITSRVKFHAMCIRRELKRLVGLSNGDATIAEGAGSFLGESLFNFLKIIADAQEELPGQARHHIRLEVVENEDACVEEEGGTASSDQPKCDQTETQATVAPVSIVRK